MFRVIVFIVFFSLFLFANQNDAKRINQLIIEIQNSSNENRYKKMNEFKILLRKMNNNVRAQAIHELQKKIAIKKNITRMKQPIKHKKNQFNIPSPVFNHKDER